MKVKHKLVAKLFAKRFGQVKATGSKAILQVCCGCMVRETVSEENMYNGGAFKAKRAPEPDDIIWENLGVRDM